MNLLQMAQRLHRESGRSGSGPVTVVGLEKDHQRLVDYISDAWLELQSRATDWRFMRKRRTATLVAGQAEYAPAELGISDFGRWRKDSDDYMPTAFGALAPSNYWHMCYMPLDVWRERYVFDEPPSGRPVDWSVDDNNTLLIGPKPDSSDTYSVRVEYLRAPTVLAADTDTPDIEPEFHLLLVWRALVEIGKFDNAPDVVARGSANFARYEDNLMARYARPLHFGAPLA